MRPALAIRILAAAIALSAGLLAGSWPTGAHADTPAPARLAPWCDGAEPTGGPTTAAPAAAVGVSTGKSALVAADALMSLPAVPVSAPGSRVYAAAPSPASPLPDPPARACFGLADDGCAVDVPGGPVGGGWELPGGHAPVVPGTLARLPIPDAIRTQARRSAAGRLPAGHLARLERPPRLG